MKVLIVDDEKLARERLVRMVGMLEDYEVIGEAASGQEAILRTTELQPDIVLLDIRMAGMDGLHAGNELANLLKPVRRDALIDTLSKVGRVNRVQHMAITGDTEDDCKPRARTHISAKTRRGIELIPLNEVRFFPADHKYVTVRHDKGEVLIDDTLRDLEEEFGERVVRIHRNALVMMDHLEGLERDARGHYQVGMRGVQERLDVSRRHVSGLRRLVQSL